jgi:alkylated DNA repair dioxygenase AlkB
MSIKLKNSIINFEYIAEFIDKEFANQLLKECEELPFSERQQKVRSSIGFGDEGVYYTVQIGDREPFTKTTNKWELFPSLLTIKKLVEKELNDVFNYCIVMRYPNGNIGIAPHRDKELGYKENSQIVGLSLGQERMFILSPPSLEKVYDITGKIYTKELKKVCTELNHGSLYIMRPPTNNLWTHCIPKEPLKNNIRYSLTFRKVDNLCQLPIVVKEYCNAICKNGKKCNYKVKKDGKCGIHIKLI